MELLHTMKKQLTPRNPNSLEFFGVRKPQSPPAHFEYINIPIRYNIENTISKWITDNLKGRFYVGKAMHITDSNSMDEALKIGFEEPKELSYFTLACPYLKYK